MSYSAAASLGTLDSWDYPTAHVVTDSDVLVLRLRAAGATLSEPSDALLFVRAAGQGQNWGMDVRGVAVADVAGSTDKNVDIVFTKGDAGLLGWAPAVMVGMADDAGSMAKNVLVDEALRQSSPNLSIVSSSLGLLSAPADAIDHWRSQPILWDHLLSGPKSKGGPTDSFAKPGDYSVVKGSADDGKRASPWKASLLEYGKDKIESLSQAQMLTIGGVAIAAIIGWKMLSK